jgi:hypothetical protein
MVAEFKTTEWVTGLKRGPVRFAALTAALVAIAALPGCASMSEKAADGASQLPYVGLPAHAPQRPAEAIAYPAVHDIPPPRTATTLTDLEQQKFEADLLAARDKQQAAAGISAPDRKKNQSPVTKPPSTPPADSRATY